MSAKDLWVYDLEKQKVVKNFDKIRQTIDLWKEDPQNSEDECYKQLCICAQFGKFDTLKIIVEFAQQFKDCRYHFAVAAFLAAQRGASRVVKYLAFKGADLLWRSTSGETLFSTHCSDDNLTTLRNLLAYDTELLRSNDMCLYAAFRANYNCQTKVFRLYNELQMSSDKQGFSVVVDSIILDNMKMTIAERKSRCERVEANIRSELAIALMEFVHPEILDFCISMWPLRLPNYVLLWIVDWLPNYCKASHIRKIRLIESISKSIRKIRRE